MKILVCGGRDYADTDTLFLALDAIHKRVAITLLIQGAASGADKLAGEWAKDRGVDVQEFPADWKRHGRGAGPKRNQQMLEQNPEVVRACPGGRGTADMIRRAEQAGIMVTRIPE